MNLTPAFRTQVLAKCHAIEDAAERSGAIQSPAYSLPWPKDFRARITNGTETLSDVKTALFLMEIITSNH